MPITRPRPYEGLAHVGPAFQDQEVRRDQDAQAADEADRDAPGPRVEAPDRPLEGHVILLHMASFPSQMWSRKSRVWPSSARGRVMKTEIATARLRQNAATQPMMKPTANPHAPPTATPAQLTLYP